MKKTSTDSPNTELITFVTAGQVWAVLWSVRQIDHLHNLGLQLDRRLRKHPSRYKKTQVLPTSPKIHRWLRH